MALTYLTKTILTQQPVTNSREPMTNMGDGGLISCRVGKIMDRGLVRFCAR